MTGIAAAHRRYPVVVQEDVGAVRRAVRALAATVPGLLDGEPELVATELATNLLRHAAEGGYLLVRALSDGVELIAVDRGPGLPASALDSLAAGTQPALPPLRGGGLGVGLATVRRRAELFDYYSSTQGTVILARLCAAAAPVAAKAAAGQWRWGAVNVPLGGAGPSGDGWAVSAGTRLAAVVVDGLGHGPEAAAAAQSALTAFEHWHVPVRNASGHTQDQTAALIEQTHQAMRGTRGGVLGACLIDPDKDELLFTGVGNIHGRILAAGKHNHLLSRPGTLGTELPVPRARATVHAWAPGSVLVLASDGIDTRWDPAAHPGLLRRHPAVLAAVIHRDHTRGTDDATVLVVKDTRTETAKDGR